MQNSRNLMDFGTRELKLAGKLLSVLKTPADITVTLGEVITPELNPDSGYVFLVDENFNVAMINNQGQLEDWVRCNKCQNEGFISEMARAPSPCCKAATQ